MAGSAAAARLAQLGETTFPRLLAKHAAERPGAPAMREKDLGIWQAMSWAELKAEVEIVAAGLSAAGFERGTKLALIGENRPRLYIGMIAAQVLGGVPVPLYQDAVAQEMVYVFRDAGITFAIVEDQEQVDKLLELRGDYPALGQIYYDDPRGLRNYDQPALSSYDSLLEAGRERLATDPGLFDREVAAGSPSDPAAIFYTSGTTGNPKGVVHGHNNLISVSEAASRLEKLGPDDNVLAYLPMAWLGQNIFSYTQWLVNGFTVNCPESDETVAADMREIGPTYYFAPPRVLEALLTQVTIRMEDAAPVKQKMFRYFLGVAKRVGERLLEGDASVGLVDRLLYRLGDFTVFGPLRNALGMSKLRIAYTAGEAIGPDLFVFFRSIGINLKQLYGSTETAVFVCIQPDGKVRPDTVGVPLEGVEVTVSDSGELLIRSPGLLREYHNNPEATAEVKDADGWYHTGDAGYFDTDGQLKIIDRAKDVGKLSDGSMFAPKYIENKLKFFPYVKEAVALGDGTDRVMVMLNIDYEACGNYAERRNIPYAGYLDLAGRPEIGKLMQECVEQVNADLAADPIMSASQIHRFLVLHKELEADDGELTRTRKVRRRFIGEKYKALVDALYDGSDHCHIETQVRFEDGRAGSVSADIRILEARVFPPAAATRAA